MTGTNVLTVDLKQLMSDMDIGHSVTGVLGIDVLEHYCIQLDFRANKIHFLDSEHVDKRGLGKAFSLSVLDPCPIINYNLAGRKFPGSLIDTGCRDWGWLMAPLFQQWTNQVEATAEGHVHRPSAVLDGEVYPDVDLDRLEERAASSDDAHTKFNNIGLYFLARHLVTFDFPKHTLYLKRTSVGPLLPSLKEQRAEGKSAYMFVWRMKRKGQLPGWPKADRFTRTATFHYLTLECGTLDFLKKGDSCIHHYKVVRASEDSPWNLQKAWGTDKDGRTVEDYPVPGHL